MIRHSLVGLTLKLGIILPFIYYGLISLINPRNVDIFYPNFIINLIGIHGTAYIGAVIAIAVAVWVFSAKYKFFSSITAAAIVGFSILLRLNDVHYVFGAIPLFTSALALSFRYYPRNRGITIDESLLKNHTEDLNKEENEVAR